MTGQRAVSVAMTAVRAMCAAYRDVIRALAGRQSQNNAGSNGAVRRGVVKHDLGDAT